MDKYIPSVNFSSAKVSTYSSWLNKEVLRVIKLQHKAWNKYLFTHLLDKSLIMNAYSKIIKKTFQHIHGEKGQATV